ncbi:cytochrome P450 [Calocera cornea HHB12733]|uniref:Cytochrome P450 n=1 Tax=Calocera cornea HHB12733 TaxID=1353952 RepID=A0A165D0W1_9BASI|nr:cytochrome P450 [Calocera cornea HHB12733]
MSVFNVPALPSYKFFNVVAVSVCASLVLALIRRIFLRGKATELVGPKNPSWLWGYTRTLLTGVSGDYFEAWQKEFGDVYRIPYPAGTSRTVFMDPRAISYVLNSNSYNYVRHKGNNAQLKTLIGGGLLTHEGDDHRRHRRSMIPGFSVASLRYFTSIFLEATSTVKDEWMSRLEAEENHGVAVLSIEQWMNAISFESIGQTGFNHDFGCLNGVLPPVGQLFTALGNSSATLGSMISLGLLQVFPFVLQLPLKRNMGMVKVRTALTDVARAFKADFGNTKEDLTDDRRSLVASIMKAENRSLSEADIIAEMNTLLIAGFETTSTTMTWCMHELSLHPKVQDKLREELRGFPEPTYEQLATEMPYLTAVVQETLRIHPIAQENHRVAAKDDSVPLLNPITTKTGKVVDHVELPAGTGIIVPIEAMNKSTLFWGPDAHEFKPERWLSELPEKASSIQGYHHLLTFIDGPR